MVFFRTSFRTSYLRFILARNYNGFVVDMDSLVPVNLHFSKELQWFRGGHGLFSSSECSFKKRNYNGFVVDMDSLGQANLHFSKELQCFCGGHGFCETVRSESNRP